MKNLAPADAAALEAVETREWLESLDYVLQQGDKGRVVRLLEALRARARQAGRARAVHVRRRRTSTRFAADEQVPYPGDREIERRIKSLVRWNALAMVVRAQPRVGRHRRPHLDVRVGGDAVRSRLQSLLPRQGRRRRCRRHLLPGPRLAGHLRARVPRRPADRSSICAISGTSCGRAAGCRRIRIRG